jgi:hypothetical protein
LESDTIQAWIIDRNKAVTAATGTKATVAETLFDLIR